MDGFDLEAIDEVIHGRVRLGVMAYLSGAGAADFNELKARLQTTDGNLSVHLRKLEDAGYVEVTKTHQGRTPATLVRLTRRGRLAFDDYTAALRALLNPAEDPPDRAAATLERTTEE